MQKRSLLYEDVIEKLYQLIDEEKIAPGDMFPSERVLIGKWDISRNVLREAFHILEQRGMITSKQGKGRYLRKVPEMKRKDPRENISKTIERYSLLEIYQVRQVLEARACRMAAERVTESDIQEMEECYRKMYFHFQRVGTTEGEFEMHRIYLEKSGNEYLKQTCETARQQVLDMMSSTFREILNNHHVEETMEEHRRILDAIIRHDADLAERLMSEHIQETIDML